MNQRAIRQNVCELQGRMRMTHEHRQSQSIARVGPSTTSKPYHSGSAATGQSCLQWKKNGRPRCKGSVGETSPTSDALAFWQTLAAREFLAPPVLEPFIKCRLGGSRSHQNRGFYDSAAHRNLTGWFWPLMPQMGKPWCTSDVSGRTRSAGCLPREKCHLRSGINRKEEGMAWPSAGSRRCVQKR